jgi:DNA-binding NtrC family response regulator
MATLSVDQVKLEKQSVAPPVKVLIVDQEGTDLDSFTTILQGRGFHVQACQLYEEALCHLNAEPYDFVIVDQGSPHFEGRCVLEQAIEKDRHVPVLVLARCHDVRCYLDAMQLGAVDYLAKPVAPAHFMRVMEMHLPRPLVKTQQRRLLFAAHSAQGSDLQVGAN